MAQLYIGIPTEYVVSKRQLAVLGYDENNLADVINEISETLPDKDYYEIVETETEIMFELKEDMVKSEWCDMIEAFYRKRYYKDSDRDIAEIYAKAFRTKDSLQDWIDFTRIDEFCYKKIKWQKRLELSRAYVNMFGYAVALDTCEDFFLESCAYGALYLWRALVKHQLRRFNLSKILTIDIV